MCHELPRKPWRHFGGRELIQRGDLGDEDSIGLCKSGGEVELENGAADGVRTRFKEGPQTNGSEFFPEARKSFADGGGVDCRGISFSLQHRASDDAGSRVF